jgi:predicted regulator of Ras-like GTPase activity (Roadblock/LC7/MglB family)
MSDERKPRVESELERLRKKVENFPSASAYNRLAELMRLGGDVTGAAQACRRCIKEFPRNGQAYVILAEIEMNSGKKEDAVKNLITAVERDPRSYTAHRMLADYYAGAGKTSQALQHLRLILAFKANDPLVMQKIEQMTGKPGSGAPAAPPASPAHGAGTARSSTTVMSVTQPAKTSEPLPFNPGKGGPVESLQALCRETGVRGALIADDKGRVVASTGLAPGQEDLLAALAAEIGTASLMAIKAIGQEKLSTWTAAASQGQVLAFKRDQPFSVVVLAEPGVRPAMLEIRARQALIDLGAA